MGGGGGWGGEGLSSRPLDKGGGEHQKAPGLSLVLKIRVGGGGHTHPYPGSATGKLGMLSIGFPRN